MLHSWSIVFTHHFPTLLACFGPSSQRGDLSKPLDKCRSRPRQFRHNLPRFFSALIDLSDLRAAGDTLVLAAVLPSPFRRTNNMLKISTIDTKSERRLVVEGKLMEPWLTELKRTWSGAGEGLQGRKLVIDLQNVTVISREGENGIYELMQEGARFSCAGVLTRHLLKRLAHSCQARVSNENRMCSSD